MTEGVGSDVCSVSQDDSPLADRSFLIDKIDRISSLCYNMITLEELYD